ncbi:MAG: extracellular solute-binding protein [Lentisphaerae bacterium]|nr:extracellular solute-binding protein [Lentisphaerota bacterium]MCP4099956.1 extracellular solute-binding protein [Lentisphaerota bacterium]
METTAFKGKIPDVIYVYFRYSHYFIKKDFLYPLDEYIKTLSPEEIEERFPSQLRPVFYRKGPNGQKHYWAMPFDDILGKILVYNKKLFKKNNIPFPDENWTWDDLLKAARKLTNIEKGTYGIRLGRGKHESWFWTTFLWSAGGEVMEYNKDTDSWKYAFDTDAAVKALDFYTRLCAEKWHSEGYPKAIYGFSYASYPSAFKKWESGEIGMMFDYISERNYSSIDPTKFGIAPVPKGPTGLRGGELNSRMFGLFSQIKEPGVRDAAWEFIYHYDNKEAKRIYVETHLKAKKFISAKYLKMFSHENLIKQTPKGWNKVLQMALTYGKLEPYGQGSRYSYREMTFPIQKAREMVISGELAPIGTKKRYKQLKKLLTDACKHANDKLISKK